MEAQRVWRVVVAVAVGLYWTLYNLEVQRAVEPLPQWIRDFLHTNAAIVVIFAALLGAGLYIGRWWALLIAAAPLPALAMLELTGHVPPFETEPLDAWLPILIFYCLPVAFGVTLRRLWTWSRGRTSVGLSS
jgi:hypothetical protein